MNASEREALIARYESGYDAIVAALAGATDAELDRRPSASDWSAREVVHHLADSETTSTIRLRRLLAEERPAIDAYDEEEFARRLHYGRPVAASLALFGAVRRSNAELLARLGDDEWGREGTHSESGRYGMDDWLRIYAAHAHDHAEQIRRARGGSGVLADA